MPHPRLKSSLCTQAALKSPAFVEWVRRIDPGHVRPDGTPKMHRKLWEWCFIAEALGERGVLGPGRRGLGFAVGREPLPALFASLGCEVLATDMAPDSAVAQGWVGTDQHAGCADRLSKPYAFDPTAFAERVSYRAVDMTDLPAELRGYDFCWSACSFEHLGSLEQGTRFVERAMDCLRPGGVAVHTTEFNLSSNTFTVAEGHDVIYRRRDIDDLAARLRSAGHAIEVDYDPGSGPLDHRIDPPPYRDEPHLKLLLYGYVVTSLGLIVVKDGCPVGRWRATAGSAWRRAASLPRRVIRRAVRLIGARP
ncbi:MAG TPA: class I SAM-dependent methyltransferase [Fimbriiglobus sp.]|nr:class I SAM-dependent methyltransferase [Fimbriiglobus sp.]